MAEKLKSISRQIHWSLLLRAAVFALAWFFFPFWLFFLVALYLYFVPLFQAGAFVIPFFVVLVLAFIHAPSVLFALALGAIFYYLLLIKDLLLIDRVAAYELLVLVLSFFLFREFYQSFGSGFAGGALWFASLIAALFGLLMNSFIKFTLDPEGGGIRRPAVLLSLLAVWQFLVLGLFLPLDFIYQSVIVFLIAVLVVDLVPEYCLHGPVRSKIFATSTVVFAFLVLILASARWGI
jgi:hypothetical protein